MHNDAAYETYYEAAPTRRTEQIIKYKQLYFEVIDTIVGMINAWFEDVESFSFPDLVNPKILGRTGLILFGGHSIDLPTALTTACVNIFITSCIFCIVVRKVPDEPATHR